MGSERQQGGMACGGDHGRANAANCFLGPELLAEFWADVERESATADSGATGGSMGGGRQQGEAVCGDGAGGAGATSCFLGPELCGGSRADVGSELQVRSRADVARAAAMAGDGNNEELMVPTAMTDGEGRRR